MPFENVPIFAEKFLFVELTAGLMGEVVAFDGRSGVACGMWVTCSCNAS